MPDVSPSQDSTLRQLADHRHWLVLIFRGVLNVVWWLTLLAGLLTLGGFFSRYSLIFELICHFRAPYAIALLCASIVLAVARQRSRAIVATLLAAINLALIVPLYVAWDRPASSSDEPVNTLRILSANVLSSNTQYKALLDLVKEQQPDIVVLSEITPQWLEAIAELKDDYPHFHEVARTDNFGLAFYSKLPAGNVQVFGLGNAGVPAISASMVHNGWPIRLYAVHLLTPSSGAVNWLDRNRALNELAEKVTIQQQPTVVVGDLNTTSWSSAFSDFIVTTGLWDSRAGFGVQPTFPSDGPLVRIPIDHCLVSASIRVVDRLVGPDIGSDHCPIIIDVDVVASKEDVAR
jgi:endonuclease/exonuclease/phosphatase (EEP) superfamily protein YafD